MPLLSELEGHLALQWVFVAVLGLLVGSFLNVVIHRLPRRMEHEWQAQCAESRGEAVAAPPPGLIWPPSQCPRCAHRIRPWQNLPIVSYLALRGRCAACNGAIGRRYPLVEGITALLSLIVLWQLGWSLQTAAGLIFTWALVALSVIDLDHLLLPGSITLPLLWVGLLLSLGGVFVGPAGGVAGAAAGYLSLWSLYHGFRLLTGKEGMGYGDFKLLAALGAWLGWQALPLVVVLSSAVGAAVGVAMVAGLGRGRDQPIPFGPYLAAAGWIALLWGEDLLAAYWRFAGLA